jgi:DNA-binding LacI/PurR family transcriptional regulator
MTNGFRRRQHHRGWVKAALQMLNEGCQPTAIQAVSDLVAIGCAETLLQQGIKIPEDISVAGFGTYFDGGILSRAADHRRQPKVPPGPKSRRWR